MLVDDNKPKLTMFLTKPDRTTIAKLKHVSDRKLTLRAKEISEVSFTVPRTINEFGETIKNPYFDYIKPDYLIKTIFKGKEDWFVIKQITEKSDESDDIEVIAFLLPYQLNRLLVLDYEENGNLKMHLDNILKGTGWSAGYINSSFNVTYRMMDVSSQTKLSFLYDLADTFEAVVQFDTVNRKIEFYKEEEISHYKGFKIGYGQYIRDIEKEIDVNEIVTRLHVSGSDDITINSVNPTGQSYIDDFSFYLYPFEMDEDGKVIKHSEYLSDDLAKTLVNYNKFVSDNKTGFNKLLQEKRELQIEKTQENNKLVEAKVDLEIILDSIAIAKKLGQPVKELNKKRNDKNKEIDGLQKKIDDIDKKIEEIDKEIEKLKTSMKQENFFTQKQLEELSNFVNEEEWSDDNIYDENDLYEAALKELKKINEPAIHINTSLVNFMQMIGEKHNWDRFDLFDIVRIHHEKLNMDIKIPITEISYGFDGDDSIGVVLTNNDKPVDTKDRLKELFYTVDQVNTDYNKRKLDYSRIAYNFNIRNDRIEEKPVNPTNAIITHKTNSDGSVNLELEWEYPDYTKTKKNEHNIDGFLIHFYSDETDEPYQFFSKLGKETIINVPLYTKSYVFPSVPADLFYTVGIRAYRMVDEDIDVEGYLLSDMVRFTPNKTKISTRTVSTLSEPIITSSDVERPPILTEPYQPEESVNFVGRINGINIKKGEEPTNPQFNDIWLDPKDFSLKIWDGNSWRNDLVLEGLKDKLENEYVNVDKLTEELQSTLDQTQKELDEAMEKLEEELRIVEEEVASEVARVYEETTIPESDTPPEEVPSSGLWWDTSKFPPRLMFWDEDVAEFVPIAPTENEILDMMEQLRQEAKREARSFSKLEIMKTRKRLMEKIEDEIATIEEDIEELLQMKDELIEVADNIDEILEEYDGKFSEMEQIVDEVNQSFQTVITNIEKIDEKVVSNTTLIQQNRDSIEQKVGKVEYERDKTGILSSIERQESSIEQLSNKIDLRVTKEEFEQNKGQVDERLAKTETNITLLEDKIELKAEKSELKDYVDLRTYNNKMASIDVSLEGINQTVKNVNADIDRLDGSYKNVTTELSEVKQTAKGITQTVSELRGEFDGLEYENRNLLPNNDIVDGWSSNRFNEVSSYHYTTNVQSTTGAFIFKRFDLDGNHIFQIQVKTNDENLLGKTIIWQSGGKDVSEKPITLSEDWQTLISVPIEGENVAVGLRIVEGTSGELLSRYLKLEKGTKATPWSPALEDTELRLSLSETSITQLKDEIKLKASQTSVDDLTGRMIQAESEIKLMPEKISLAVKDGIDELEIGGRNLASKNNIGKWSNGWVEENYVYTLTGDRAGLYIKADVFKAGERYVLTFKAKKISGTVTSLAGHCTNYTIHKVIRDGVLQSTNWSSGLDTNPYPDDEEVHDYEIHFTAKDFAGSDNNFYIQPNRLHYGLDYVMKIWDLMLEKGNKVTDWTPAPEDQVNKTNVLSSINLSTEGVKIQGDKIDLVGLVTALNADGTPGTMIQGNKIVTGSITANQLNVNEIFGNSAVIAKIQSDSIATANLSANQITTGTLSAARIASKSITAEKLNVDSLSALSADLGTVTAGTIRGVDITGSTITSVGDDLFQEVRISNGSISIIDIGKNALIQIKEGRFVSGTLGSFLTPTNGDARMTLDKGKLQFEYYRTNSPLPEVLPNGWVTGIKIKGSTISSDDYIVFNPRLKELGVRFNSDITVEKNTDALGRIKLVNASGSSNALKFPSGHMISKGRSSGDFFFYGNRANSQSPFVVRSHVNESSYRNDLEIKSNGNTYVNGALYEKDLWDRTTSNSVNARIGTATSSGYSRIMRSTSARKYKMFIEEADVDPYKILELKPKSWIDKGEYIKNGHSTEGLKRHYGIIADEMEEIGLSEYVDYANGEVENIVERAWTLLIPIVKDLHNDVESMKYQNVVLNNKNNLYESKLSALDKRLRRVESLIEQLINN